MEQGAGSYHEKTSYNRSNMGGHFLDWQNQPDVFKVYEARESMPMPREIPLPRENLFTLYERTPEPRTEHDVLDLETLSRILLLTYNADLAGASAQWHVLFSKRCLGRGPLPHGSLCGFRWNEGCGSRALSFFH